MKKYLTIFFWFSGLLTETMPEGTRLALFPQVNGRKAIDWLIELRGQAEQLSLGKITAQEYCRQALEICASEQNAENLAEKLIVSASLHSPALEIINNIPQDYKRWLVVDYPVAWYRELAHQWNLASVFPASQVIFTAELQLPRLVPEIFYHLPAKTGRAMDDCLMIDPVTSRAVQAMRHGLATIIYVYPQRLKHELALQGIWQTETDVMHPKSSERVKM